MAETRVEKVNKATEEFKAAANKDERQAAAKKALKAALDMNNDGKFTREDLAAMNFNKGTPAERRGFDDKEKEKFLEGMSDDAKKAITKALELDTVKTGADLLKAAEKSGVKPEGEGKDGGDEQKGGGRPRRGGMGR